MLEFRTFPVAMISACWIKEAMANSLAIPASLRGVVSTSITGMNAACPIMCGQGQEKLFKFIKMEDP